MRVPCRKTSEQSWTTRRIDYSDAPLAGCLPSTSSTKIAPGAVRADVEGSYQRDQPPAEIFQRKTGSFLARSARSEMRARQIRLAAPSDIAGARK
jgi:hypothetical protein